MMNVKMEEGWKSALMPEFGKLYFELLTEFIRREYRGSVPIYPPGAQIFRAFDVCPFKQTKVVILGQDPYHGPGQAEGLAFSVPFGVETPPSLRNIYQEIATDLGRPPHVCGGNLLNWAQQGVLLLNATLTVRAHSPASHQGKGWEALTDAAIATLDAQSSGIVFMLWGASARRKASMIDRSKHLILEAPHPSPLSASRGFFGCKHFSKANAYLISQGKAPIDW